MANAVKTIQQVLVTKEVPIISLTLSEDEAAALRRLCMAVGGDPYRTRRGMIDSIAGALGSIEIPSYPDDTHGYVYFQEEGN